MKVVERFVKEVEIEKWHGTTVAVLDYARAERKSYQLGQTIS